MNQYTFSLVPTRPKSETWNEKLEELETRDVDQLSKEIRLTDLEHLGPEKQYDEDGKERYIKVRDTEENVVNKEDPYINYDDWKDGDYKSDQFEWPMQKLYLNKFKEEADKWKIYDQESFDVADMTLAPLDIEKDIMDDFTVLLIGRRRSGKTWIARWIMYHLRHRFPCGVVITGTKLNHFWQKHIPVEFIHDIEDMDLVLRSVFKRQEYVLEHPELGIDPRMFVILDDILSEKYKVRFSKALAQAFTDGRHHKLFILVTSQDPKGIPPDLRENADLCVVFRQYQKSRKKSCSEEYLDYIDDDGQRASFIWKWSGIVDEKGNYSEDENNPHLALAILQAKVTDDLQKIFKVVISEDPGEFYLGDYTYWNAMEKGMWVVCGKTFGEVRKESKKRNGANNKKEDKEKNENKSIIKRS